MAPESITHELAKVSFKYFNPMGTRDLLETANE